MKDDFGIHGNIKYELFDEHGNLKYIYVTNNDITVLHDAVVAAKIRDPASSTVTTYGFIDLGTSTGGTTASTDLVAAHGDARIGISKATSAGAADNDVVVTAFIPAGSFTGTLTEAGLFRTSAANPDMMCYDDSISIVKAAGDTLGVTWTITYGV